MKKARKKTHRGRNGLSLNSIVERKTSKFVAQNPCPAYLGQNRHKLRAWALSLMRRDTFTRMTGKPPPKNGRPETPWDEAFLLLQLDPEWALRFMACTVKAAKELDSFEREIAQNDSQPHWLLATKGKISEEAARARRKHLRKAENSFESQLNR